MEVGADDDEPRARSTLAEQLLDELLRRFLAARLVEREHDAFVDRAGGFEQLELLIERGEQLRRRLGPHDLGRMTVEREHRRAEAARLREIVHEPEHGLMTEVHAVERADRDRPVGGRPRRALRLGSRKIFIRPRRLALASTTAGFTPAPRRS